MPAVSEDTRQSVVEHASLQHTVQQSGAQVDVDASNGGEPLCIAAKLSSAKLVSGGTEAGSLSGVARYAHGSAEPPVAIATVEAVVRCDQPGSPSARVHDEARLEGSFV
eukprot:CAMPEP_0119091672 /NCGR_PEP_ID=MMETSP1178-20130426/157095_1 /TAXON_ID=33656 /ORGANISM="unid sp, Strain CCMP2000" /LENGTH=108 /DNA_ID=CAMNT_0007075197 /DNA_START=286 /DNA_END=611 /DNA_ORIENTATION=-